jgi:hypothetical protein
MKIWGQISTISAWGGGFLAFVWWILGKYSKPYFWPFFIVTCLAVSMYLLSEIMKYILKIKERQDRMNS